MGLKPWVVVATTHPSAEAIGRDSCTILYSLRIKDGLIHPVPDAAAHHSVAIFNNIPIFAQIPYSLPHGMGIFAHNKGLTFATIAQSFCPLNPGVHLRIHIRSLVAMAMYESGIEIANSVIAVRHILSPSVFVAQRPENYRGVVTVAKHHTHIAIHEGIGPGGVARKIIIAMTFQIGLIDAIKAVGIHHLIHLWLTRIMAGADSVYICLLHQLDIAKHCLHIHITSILGMGVMGVDSFNK